MKIKCNLAIRFRYKQAPLGRIKGPKNRPKGVPNTAVKYWPKYLLLALTKRFRSRRFRSLAKECQCVGWLIPRKSNNTQRQAVIGWRGGDHLPNSFVGWASVNSGDGMRSLVPAPSAHVVTVGAFAWTNRLLLAFPSHGAHTKWITYFICLHQNLCLPIYYKFPKPSSSSSP